MVIIVLLKYYWRVFLANLFLETSDLLVFLQDSSLYLTILIKIHHYISVIFLYSYWFPEENGDLNISEDVLYCLFCPSNFWFLILDDFLSY